MVNSRDGQTMLQQLQHEKLRLARVSWSKHALNYTCTSLQNTINPVQKEIFPLFSHSNCALKLKSKQKESNTAQSTKKKKGKIRKPQVTTCIVTGLTTKEIR